MKLVPFNPQWLQMDGLDLKGIYRRPRRHPVTWEILRDPETGFILWDIMGPQPIRASTHAQLLAKGCEYITLASPIDLRNAAGEGLPRRGVQRLQNPQQYRDQWDYRGPWLLGPYLAWQADQEAQRLETIAARVEEMGPDAAELFEQQRDPGYRLPARYRRPKQELEPPQSQPQRELEPPVKRKRGRPKGSKNTPKIEPVEPVPA